MLKITQHDSNETESEPRTANLEAVFSGCASPTPRLTPKSGCTQPTLDTQAHRPPHPAKDGYMVHCLEAVAGPGGHGESTPCQDSSISLFLGQPPVLIPRYTATLALSYLGISISNPRANVLL